MIFDIKRYKKYIDVNVCLDVDCVDKNRYVVNILVQREHFISVLAFYFQEEKLYGKEEKSSRYAVMRHLMAIMGIDVDEATHLVAEMEKAELIQFDELGIHFIVGGQS